MRTALRLQLQRINRLHFDCVSHEILLKKMKLYNFSESVVEWMRDYLSYIPQYVSIGNRESQMQHIKRGVPQGSVLGPTLYTIYVNELSEVANRSETCKDDNHKTTVNLFNSDCKECGTIYGYADNSTYLRTGKNRDKLQIYMSSTLQRIEQFLSSNELSINTSKTILIEIMLHQKH